MRILIIEDDQNCAELVARMIRAAGIETTECKSVPTLREGLEESRIFEPSLIFLDLTLPPIGESYCIDQGIPAFNEVAPVVVWTGSSTPDVVVKCHEAGAQACLKKDNIITGKCGIDILAQVVIQSMLNWRREYASKERS